MTKQILIADIIADFECQPREHIDTDYVSELKEALQNGAKLPPIEVFGRGPYYTADGFHRLEANRQLGFVTIDASVGDGDASTAFRASLGANAEHGKRRTNSDKRRAIERALQHPDTSGLTDRAIADLCKVTPSTVGHIRPQVQPQTEESEFDQTPQKRTGLDGRQYKVKKTTVKKLQSTPEKPEIPQISPKVKAQLDEANDNMLHVNVLVTRLTGDKHPYGKIPTELIKSLKMLQKHLECRLSEDRKSVEQIHQWPK